MRLLDKIALQRLISLLLNFTLALLKLFAPKSIEDIETPEEKKKPWRPFRRKKS
jgi:hypothetical protein